MKKILFLILFLLVSQTAFAEVAFRANSEVAYGARINTEITKPTGTTDNDVILVFLTVDGTTAVTAPAGWTEYTGSPWTWSHYNWRVHAYWKRASSEGASWTWTHASDQTWAMALSYSGVITTGDPNDATPTVNEDGSQYPIGLSITSSNPNSKAIFMWTFGTSITGPVVPPSGFVEVGNPLAGSYIAVEDKILTSQGATGDVTADMGSTDWWFSFFTALKKEPDISKQKSQHLRISSQKTSVYRKQYRRAR